MHNSKDFFLRAFPNIEKNIRETVRPNEERNILKPVAEEIARGAGRKSLVLMGIKIAWAGCRPPPLSSDPYQKS